MGLNIIVTGAAGFIGSHLCEALLAAGHRVTGLDNFDEFYDPAIKRRNIATAISHPKFTIIEGDVRDREVVAKAFAAQPQVIIHLAARAGVRPSIEQPALYQDVNIGGTMVLLEAARHVPDCRFIFGSSSSVYGNNPKVPFAESDPVEHPISPYAATKRAGELLCYTFHHLYNLHVTCLRFFTVYGPRQRPDLAIHKFARLMDMGRPIPVFGDGSMARDYTYIDDIVQGVLCAIERCDGYAIYNLGESQPILLRDLITAIERAMGTEAIIDRLPPQPGDVQRTFADISRARQKIGYDPQVNMATGLKRFVDWFREENSTSK